MSRDGLIGVVPIQGHRGRIMALRLRFVGRLHPETQREMFGALGPYCSVVYVIGAGCSKTWEESRAAEFFLHLGAN